MDTKKFLEHFNFWNKLEASFDPGNLRDCVTLFHVIIMDNKQACDILEHFNNTLEGNGLTFIRSKFDDTLLYILADMGDLYVPTIAYDVENKKLVLTDEGSLREYIEDIGREYYITSGYIQ